MLAGDPLDFRNHRRTNASPGCARDDIAGSQFRVAEHERADSDRLTINLGHQSNFIVAVPEKAVYDFVGYRQRRPSVNDGSRIVLRCETPNGLMMNLEKTTCFLGPHGADRDGHCTAILYGFGSSRTLLSAAARP